MNKEFNKLQESFKEYLKEKEPPSFIWENIAQELEFHETSLLKESFEEFYKKADINLPPLDESFFERLTEEEDSDLKEHFEEFYDPEVPPKTVQSTIFKTLDQDGTSLLKDNFEEFYQEEKLNQQIWTNIQDKMDVQNVWSGMQPQLDRLEHQYYWRNRFKRFSAVALLLLLLRTCIGDVGVEQNLMGEQTTPAKLEVAQHTQQAETTSPATNNTPSVISKTNLSREEVAAIDAVTEQQAATISAAKNVAKNTYSLNKQPLQDLNPSSKHNTKTNYKDNLTTNHSNSTTKHLPLAGIPQRIPTSDDPTQNQLHLQVTKKAENRESYPEQDHTNIRSHKHEITTSQDHTNTTLPTLELANIAALKPTAFELKMPEAKSEKLVLLDAENQDKKSSSKQFPKFELGIIAKLGTSFLLNDKTKEGLRYRSIEHTQLYTSADVSLLGAIRVSAKDGLIFQVTPYNPVKQTYGSFSTEGIYTQQEIKLSYLDFSIGYERELITFNNMEQEPIASIFARATVGLSYQTMEQIAMNGIVSSADTFQKWNGFSTLSLGSKHHINRFVIEYGINTAIGFSNISTNSSLFQQTNTFAIGLFMGLRYKF